MTQRTLGHLSDPGAGSNSPPILSRKHKDVADPHPRQHHHRPKPLHKPRVAPDKAQTVLMNLHPLWMLAPWAVFALAAGIKFWRITAVFRKRGLERDTSTERFRKTLERIWKKDQQAAR